MKNRPCLNLILYGYKSSGKSYFGKLLAHELGKIFIDTDLLIEADYEKHFHEKLSCRQIALTLGEEGFRQLERKIITSLQDVTDSIIAVGGGTVLHTDNYSSLSKNGVFVYLKADKRVIKQRIFNEGIPSFLDPKNPKESFEKMYEERKPIYLKLNQYIVDIHQKTNKQILNELIFITDIKT